MKEKKLTSYQDLEVWKRSISLVTDIYEATKNFPAEEKFGIQLQIRRAAVSIPSNIAEGHARQSRKEFAQFVSISMGSVAEIETQLVVVKNLDWIK